MIVLDTHVWVWWLSAGYSFSSKVQKLLNEGKTKQTVYISSINKWGQVFL